MNLNQDDIETLILSNICNVATKEEKELLDKLLKEDPSIQLLYEKMKKMYDGPVKEYLKIHPASELLQEALETTRKKDRKVLMGTWFAGAAAILIIALMILKVSFPGSRRKETALLQSIPTPSKSVLLRLPRGETISLDSSSQQINSKSVDLITDANTLHYHSISRRSTESASLFVPAGKDYKIFLNDGSEIHLNSATELIFPLTFSGRTREITINGEAYIKVVKKANQPFIVHLPHGSIEVLGTAFNVNTYDSGVHKIALLHGSLKVNTAKFSIILKPGEEAITKNDGISTVPFDASAILAWQEGKYYIEAETLNDLTAIISRWYGTTVIIDSDNAGKQRFSGLLRKDQPLEDFLKGIKITNAIHYEMDKNGIYHIW